jgi:hypothetical protein
MVLLEFIEGPKRRLCRKLKDGNWGRVGKKRLPIPHWEAWQ